MRRRLDFLLACLALAVLLVPGTASQARDMTATEKRLLADLQATPAFRQKIPAASQITRLEFAGSVIPGDLVFGADPEEIAVVPKAIAAGLAVNCNYTQTTVRSGSVAGTFANSASFTTTHGWEIGTSFSFTADWPVVESTWSFSASYNGSVAEMTGEEESWTITENWSVPLLPRTEADVQMQVTQQEIEGQPYHLDLELLGRALIYYKPVLTWVDSRGHVPANAIIGGSETSPTSGKERDLPICRAWYAGAQHPGKVVAGNCNISWGGKEYERGRFQVLTGDKSLFDWKKHKRGSTDKESGVVAGQENRDDQHEGKLYVCRGKHKGGTHPGKLVINHCMFGYGGEEILRTYYDILTFAAGKDKRFAVTLQDYLPLEKRTFRVEGAFNGTKSLSAYSYVSPSRPVTEFRCPSAPSNQVAQAPVGEGAPVARSVSIEKAPRNLARAASGGGAELELLKDATLLRETPLPADELATAEPAPVLNARVLRLESPHLFGPDVLALQQALIAAGWPIRADGFHGPGTDQALRHFQRAHRLTEDGLFGPRTQAMMGL